MSCKKAQGFLERNQLEPRETVDATRTRLGRQEALALARTATRIVVARGKNTIALDMRSELDDDALASHLLGPTGNLRAPTVRRGKTLYVGFSDAAYRELAG